MLNFVTVAAATGFDWSTLDLSAVLSNFYLVVPIAAGIVIAFIAFRKAWGFLIGLIRRA